MPEIIPAIIAKNFADFKKKVESVENYVNWVQLDVVDGDFAPNISWGDPLMLKNYDSSVFIEAHLMIQKPEKTIRQWVESGIKRVFYHYESTSAHQEIIDLCKKGGVEVAPALLPETPLTVLAPLVSQLNYILLLGVHPGFYGSKFQEQVIDKIRRLHQMYPHLTIEVDGGMNPQTAKQAVEAGAELIVAGSYIFRSDEPKEAIEEMREAIK